MMQRGFSLLLQKVFTAISAIVITVGVCSAQLQQVQSIPIFVNYSQTVHLVFPVSVKYYESVSDFVACESPAEAPNIVRIKANTENFKEHSNVSVATEDGAFYTYNLVYNSKPTTLLYRLQGDQQVILTDNRINSREKGDVVKQLKERKQKLYNLGLKKSGMIFTVKNIAIYKDALCFVISLANKTNIPYDIDYIRYSITDKKIGKLTASQEEEKSPMFGNNHTTKRIDANSTLNYIVAFDKFSLADDKVFRIEINETGGGRHIVFDVENKDLEECEQL